MLREAHRNDVARMEAFLGQYAESSMFLRSNLAAHGVDDRESPYGTRFYLQDSEDGVTAVFGRSNGGYLMVQAPQAPAALFASFAKKLQGQKLLGITGDDDQVRSALQALALPETAFKTNHAEPLYRLDLRNLQAPDGEIRAPRPEDVEWLALWSAMYDHETGVGPDDGGAAKRAMARAVAAIGQGRTRLLIEDGEAVAMTGINAQVADMCQVGGVFTPKPYRNRGYARRVVAAHLAELHQHGINTAILFANNAAAARAYEAIGFEQVGYYRVAILKQPQILQETP